MDFLCHMHYLSYTYYLCRMENLFHMDYLWYSKWDPQKSLYLWIFCVRIDPSKRHSQKILYSTYG